MRKIVKYAPKSSEDFILRRMELEKASGYIKKGTFTDEVVWGSYSYIFPSLNKKQQSHFKKGMFLFGMVRKDAKNYIASNEIILPKRYGQIEYNEKLDVTDLEESTEVTGTDLNHAYWRIALNLGIITDKTYYKGLGDEFKSVRLAALSTLGSNKKYQKIKNGVITNEIMVIEGDDDLKKVYTLIRYTCYKYMSLVKKMLGKDFLCYKTDCIYYIDNKENRKKVKEFFEKKDLQMKQLER